MTLHSIFGWLGAFLFLFSYVLVSSKKIKADSVNFHLYNFLGAIGVTVDTFYQSAWSAVALNFLWGLIAAYHLVKYLSKLF